LIPPISCSSCGGAFSGLEKIISGARAFDLDRFRGASAGAGRSGAPARSSATSSRGSVEVRLIPEFVDGFPVVATLEISMKPSLKKILTDPKNALVKQYQRLFEMENIELTFADRSAWRGGPQGHRAQDRRARIAPILESILLETMFDLPGLEGVEEVVISRRSRRGDSASALHLQPTARIVPREQRQRLSFGVIRRVELPQNAAAETFGGRVCAGRISAFSLCKPVFFST